jgi:hypothetical protein
MLKVSLMGAASALADPSVMKPTPNDKIKKTKKTFFFMGHPPC